MITVNLLDYSYPSRGSLSSKARSAQLAIESKLAAGQHNYLLSGEAFELNTSGSGDRYIWVKSKGRGRLVLRLALIFTDSKGERIATHFSELNREEIILVPPLATAMEFGFRASGAGQAIVSNLTISQCIGRVGDARYGILESTSNPQEASKLWIVSKIRFQEWLASGSKNTENLLTDSRAGYVEASLDELLNAELSKVPIGDARPRFEIALINPSINDIRNISLVSKFWDVVLHVSFNFDGFGTEEMEAEAARLMDRPLIRSFRALLSKVQLNSVVFQDRSFERDFSLKLGTRLG